MSTKNREFGVISPATTEIKDPELYPVSNSLVIVGKKNKLFHRDKKREVYVGPDQVVTLDKVKNEIRITVLAQLDESILFPIRYSIPLDKIPFRPEVIDLERIGVSEFQNSEDSTFIHLPIGENSYFIPIGEKSNEVIERSSKDHYLILGIQTLRFPKSDSATELLPNLEDRFKAIFSQQWLDPIENEFDFVDTILDHEGDLTKSKELHFLRFGTNAQISWKHGKDRVLGISTMHLGAIKELSPIDFYTLARNLRLSFSVGLSNGNPLSKEATEMTMGEIIDELKKTAGEILGFELSRIDIKNEGTYFTPQVLRVEKEDLKGDLPLIPEFSKLLSSVFHYRLSDCSGNGF